MSATTPTATVQANRYNEVAVLLATATNEDGDTIMRISLPQSMGDVVILEICVLAYTFATIATTYYEFGIQASIVGNTSGARVDVVGDSRFRATRGTLAAPTQLESVPYIKPDSPVLWKQGERLEIIFPELDTNAVPTADVEVYAKVQRYNT